eukprot:scaffold434_cov186-Pinguiococcus_pyrenoidosus.AAC.5
MSTGAMSSLSAVPVSWTFHSNSRKGVTSSSHAGVVVLANEYRRFGFRNRTVALSIDTIGVDRDTTYRNERQLCNASWTSFAPGSPLSYLEDEGGRPGSAKEVGCLVAHLVDLANGEQRRRDLQHVIRCGLHRLLDQSVDGAICEQNDAPCFADESSASVVEGRSCIQGVNILASRSCRSSFEEDHWDDRLRREGDLHRP